MRKIITALVLVFIFSLVLVSMPAFAYTDACWGQASAAIAEMGEMGEHASQ